VPTDQSPTEIVQEAIQPNVTLRDAFWTWCRVALLSFGGPAGQIAVMHRIIVDEKKSILTTWVTFVPCFFWVFLGAPYIEQLRGNKRLNAALSAITAAVVGVVLNLAVWFSIHTLFAQVTTTHFYGLRLQVPHLASANIAACVIAIVACLLTFYWKKGMAVTLSVSAALGTILFLVKTSGIL
jgi:hypothetical protein